MTFAAKVLEALGVHPGDPLELLEGAAASQPSSPQPPGRDASVDLPIYWQLLPANWQLPRLTRWPNAPSLPPGQKGLSQPLLERHSMNIHDLLQLEPWEWPPTAAATLKAVILDRSRPTPERIQATLCLGEGGLVDEPVAQILLSLLSAADESEELRAAAAISFGPALEEADEDLDFIEDKFSQATLQEIQKRLRQLFDDPSLPVLLRRRVLEAAVRAPQSWHRTAVTEAFASKVRDWRLTAVFCMRHLGGFNKQVLQALHDQDQEIRCEAIQAAGAFEIKEAWPVVAPLATAKDADKDLRLAAIEAIATIRPKKARKILLDLVDDHDEDIAAVAEEALAMAGDAGSPFFDD